MITPDNRMRLLKDSIDRKGFVRIIEAHNGISALVGESAKIESDQDIIEFDGLWESSLTDSAAKGLPDVELVGLESRLSTINEILGVTRKPIIVDGDTGRSAVEFEYLVRNLERLGVSAVIIEDKVYPKRNSLDASANQTLADPDEFAQKIERGKKESLTSEFMIIARLESLIAGTGLSDALARAEKYINAGVDGIMIHSQKSQPDEILAFADSYDSLCQSIGRRPLLVCVPTTYNAVTDKELAEHGFDIMIHANHLLRSAYKAMQEAAVDILVNDRSLEAERLCSPTSEIFSLVGFDRIKEQDRHYSKEQRYEIIIPAAGKDPVFAELPKSMIQVNGQSILDHQVESLRKAGLTNNKVIVVRGHEGDRFTRTDVEYIDNDKYLETHSLHSLFCAEPAMTDGFILVYSDVLFDAGIIRRLVESTGDIVLLVDNSYRYHKHDVDKKLDLATGTRQYSSRRRLQTVSQVRINRIGKRIPVQMADYEFVGIALFNARGAQILRDVYRDARNKGTAPFHESSGIEQANVTDILQEIIDQGFPIQGLELSTGWIEIHNREDVGKAGEQLEAVRADDD